MEPINGPLSRRAVLACGSSAAMALVGAALLPRLAEAAPLPVAPAGNGLDDALVQKAQAVVVVPRRRRRVCWWRRGRRVCAWR